MNLRDYQIEGKEEICNAWDNGSDILMFLLATGGGKTVTFVELIKDILLKGKRCMLIAHREELIMQSWQTLYNNNIYAGIIMGAAPTDYSLPVQVCSIQTVARRQKLPDADYLIIDEGHHATRDNSYGKLIKRYISAKVLLVTATSYRLSGEGFKYIHQYKETKLIKNRSLKELQDQGWLVPLRYFIASIPDLSDVHLRGGDYVEEEAQEAMGLAPIVDSYFDHAKGKSGVCFTISVSHSINTTQRYLYAGVPAEHLDANTPDKERKKIVSDFRAGLVKIISNVGIITEGFDFPNMDFVQLARPTKSLSMYLQMVGRVTRPLSGIVDVARDAKERIEFIKRSTKPYGIILDNAGCWQDHNLPTFDHDWSSYFYGKKKEKEQPELEDIEMFYLVEDDQGKRFKTKNPKEIEGLKLVEITHEKRQLIINLVCLKEFDRLYAMFKNIKSINKPGYVAFSDYLSYCNKRGILMVDEIWNYLHKKLVSEIQSKIDKMAHERSKHIAVYPEDLYTSTVNSLKNQGVSQNFLLVEKQKYNQAHFEELERYRNQTRVA